MKKEKYFLTFILLTTVLLNISALKNGFYWDDRPLIVDRPLVHSWKNLPTIFSNEMFFEGDPNRETQDQKIDTYRPLSNVSFLLDASLWGFNNPVGFHFTNLAIHLINIFLLFWIAKFFLSPGLALLACGLFGLHPLSSECIHYVSARTDSLMLLFSLLSVGFFCRRIPPKFSSLIWSSLFFFFAMLTKETAAVLFLLFGVGVWIQNLKSQKTFLPKWFSLLPSFLAVFLYGILRMVALQRPKLIYDSHHPMDIVLGFPQYVFHFMEDFFWPSNPMPMQDFVSGSIFPLFGSGLLALVSYTGYGLLLWAAWRMKKSWGWGWIWTLLFLIPPFFVVSLTEITNPRYYYPSLAGFSFGVFGVFQEVWKLQKYQKWVLGLGIGLLVIFGICSKQAARSYQTEVHFYEAILKGNPHHSEAEYNLGNTFFRNQNLNEAIRQYQRVVKHNPKQVSALNNLGVAFLHKGNFQKALESFLRVLQMKPKEPKYLFNLSLAYEGLGKEKESIQWLKKSFEENPNYMPARDRILSLCNQKKISDTKFCLKAMNP